ncbi:hypothetical protein HG530_008445 [Fusarium avenaceum]|nr:hypothetical protein HG530_008445 [Fusarium avenaceum]
MSDSNSQVVVGCLLDVSGSMRETLEPNCSRELPSERLGDVLRAALKLAQAEKRQNPNAVMFVGAFGLRTSKEAPSPPAVDLCRIADSLLDDTGNHVSGHELLIAWANQNNDYEDHQKRDPVDDENVNQLDTLRRYMYGPTPMCHALGKALDSFQKRQNAKLVLISDGGSTDGNPTAVATDLRNKGISIVTVSLTEKTPSLQRTLHCEANPSWDQGTRTPFTLATRVPASSHPIPVLASVGWKIPSAGEIALFSSVCSATVLDEFCSLLLSARFGSTDALLDIVGRIHFDDYINQAHLEVRRKPSDQGTKGTCYAHATASVVHMALLRIVSRDGGVPSLGEIRVRILSRFPETKNGYDTSKVLKAACGWYRPLQYREIDEDKARQAVLHRRPVLATFDLSKLGWDEFCGHFDQVSQSRGVVLTQSQMAPYYFQERDGGHAVVLVGCSPNSLTFLNSWGSSWGNNGSFSIENHRVLGRDNEPMRFYDVYWLESKLTSAEQQAYDDKVDEELHRHANNYPVSEELSAQTVGNSLSLKEDV